MGRLNLSSTLFLCYSYRKIWEKIMVRKLKELNFKPMMAIVILLLILVGCSSNEEAELNLQETPSEAREFLMGTYIVLRVYDEGKEEALGAAVARIEELDEKLTSNNTSSEIASINEAAGQNPVEVSEDVFPLIEVAAEYSAIENSGFDYTVGPITNLWRIGFDDARVPEPSEIEAVLPLVDYEKSELDAKNRTVFLTEENMRIDLGAIAKGYIADEIVKVFEDHNVTTAIIDLGGNVVVMGDSPTRETGGFNVGIQDPFSPRGEIVGAINLKNKTVVTSGVYERYIEKDDEIYHHLMNPDTGYPFENDLAGVSIVTDKSVDGDGLSTVVFGFGLEEGLDYVNRLEGVEGVFISRDKEIYTSEGLKENFNLTNDTFTWVNE